MSQTIQIRRDTSGNWTSANPILAQGEMGLETDTLKIKWGNGVSHWNSLAYFTGSGGGGLNMKGTAVINFGSTPGTNLITTTVLDVNVTALSKIILFMGSDATATHTKTEHQMVNLSFTVDNIVAGVSFDVTSFNDYPLTGTFNINYLII